MTRRPTTPREHPPLATVSLVTPPDAIRHEYVYANGLRFHVAAAGEGDKLALLLHGFPELWYSWRHQMPLLARLGYKVWAPDLRGYGETDRPDRMRDYAIETLMDDVAGLIDASGTKSTFLLAHDWGGLIAAFFATRKVRPLERFGLMNIPHPGAAREHAGWRQRMRSWYAMFFQIPGLPERIFGGDAERIGRMLRNSAGRTEAFRDEDVEVYRKAAAQPGAAKAMVDYYRALGARRRHGAADEAGLPADRGAVDPHLGHRGRRARHRADARHAEVHPGRHHPLPCPAWATGSSRKRPTK